MKIDIDRVMQLRERGLNIFQYAIIEQPGMLATFVTNLATLSNFEAVADNLSKMIFLKG